MTRRTNPVDDDWHHVKDAKKRKQIQDRLAQRARRQRLRRAKLLESQKPSEKAQLEHMESNPSLENCSDSLFGWEGFSFETSCGDFVDLLPTLDPNLGLSTYTLDFSHLYSTNVSCGAIASPRGQPTPPLTVYSALFLNGEMLGLQCSTTHEGQTPEPNPSLPLPLHPTELQRLMVHHRWIDRLPFPAMRDSLIKFRGLVDEEELLRDLFTMPSWTIDCRKAAWDPEAWLMEEEWAKKWGWLMS